MANWNVIPCARCGARAELRTRIRRGRAIFYVECTRNPAHLQLQDFPNAKLAAFDWNRQQNDLGRAYHRSFRRFIYGYDHKSADRKR